MSIVPGPRPFVELVTYLLSRGYRVRFRAEGASMRPTVRGGEKITVEPVSEVKMGDIALYLAERGLIAHRVVGIRKENGKAPVFLTRGEAIGSAEEAVHELKILGRVVAAERNGRSIDLAGRWAKICCRARRFAYLARHWCATLGGIHTAGISLLAFILFAIFPDAARAVVGITATTSTSAATGNVCSLTITPPAGSQVVVVTMSVTNANAPFTFTNSAGTVYTSFTGGNPSIGIWALTIPAGTTSVTFSITAGSATGYVCGAQSFSGVNTSVLSSFFAGSSGGSGSPATVSGAVNPGAGGLLFNALSTGAGASTITATPGTGQVQQWNLTGGGNGVGAAAVFPGSGTAGSGTISINPAWSEIPTNTPWETAWVPLPALSPTEVNPTSFIVSQRAFHNQIENVIELKTGREVSSLGFNLYREQNGQRVKLNSSLLAGTALLAGSTTTLTSGHVHTWWDIPSGASRSAKYWVEEVDLHGQHTWFGPATPTSAAANSATSVNSTALTTDAKGQVMFLSQVGQETGAPATGAGSVTHPLQAHVVRTTNISQAGEKQFALAAGHAVKIGVQSEGWYQVSLADLVAAGLDPNADANTLQLYAEGVEQPILVQGQIGNKLGPQSNIQFYGTGIDATWSDTRIYWLTWGKASGQRVQTEARRSAATAGASSFPFTVEWMPRTVYFAALLDGDGSNNFFGPVLTSGDPVSQAITITNLEGNGASSAQLQVTLQGVSDTSHMVEVALNGREVGAVTFSNQTEGTETMAVPAAALLEGQNQLTLTVDGGDEDVSVVDSVELTYPHSYTATADSLRFTALSGQAQKIGGFSNSQITVVDISNPDAATLVRGAITQQAGSYNVSIVPQGGGTRTLLAFTSAQGSQPASITAHHPSKWHAPQEGFDMVMISHANFVQSLGPLVSLHQGQGLKTAVIDVEDLYDEFNFGEKSPNALKDFLSTAKAEWQLPPRFVMLVGDATFDPRNYLGTGNFDFVPTYLVDTAQLQTASDDWYADFSGQGLPQMAIGRLPVRTAQEAAALVSKIVNYDQSGDAGWKQQVLLVEDQDDSEDNFQGDAAAVKALLPGDLTVSEISESDPNASELLLNSLNVQGEAMVDYIGHGSEEVWASSLFNSTDAGGLTNGPMVPFVVSMTCLNGYFQDVYGTALTKALIEAPGGGLSRYGPLPA
jgi:Peptidase family C25